jgi:hypothetical protein
VVNLTRTPDTDESFPAWTPNGRLGFVRYHQGQKAVIWVVDADGGNPVMLPGASGYELGPMAWTAG